MENRYDDFLLKELLVLDEVDLTKKYIIPLFKSLGYSRVDYHGGPYEKGRDLICEKINELGEIEITVIQVKKYKPSAKSAGNATFSAIINQLQQAVESKVPSIDGNKYMPSNVYFITPYQIDRRMLESRFEGYSSIRRARVLDGVLLLKLLNEHTAELIKELAGSDVLLQEIAENIPANTDLFRAINYDCRVDVSDYYCDLSLSIGSIMTKFYFSIEGKTEKVKVRCSEDEWANILYVIAKGEACFGVKMIDIDASIVEEDYRKKKEVLLEAIFSLTDKLSKQDSFIETCTEKKRYLEDKIEKGRIQKQIDDARILYNRLDSDRQVSEKTCTEEKRYLEDKIEIGRIQKQIDDALILYNRFDSDRKVFEKDMATLGREFIVDGSHIAQQIKNKQAWLRLSVDNNLKNESLLTVRELLNECNALFRLSNALFSVSDIVKASGISDAQKYKTDMLKMNLPLDKILDTRENVLVLGAAGSGKTTSLYMYAKKKILVDKDDYYLFIALSSLIKGFTKKTGGMDPVDLLVKAIIKYYRNNGVNIKDFDTLIKNKKVALLLDGVDEVIMSAPWIVDGIIGISERYPSVQVVISSRVSGEYVKKIPFISITLLPLDDEQVMYFVDKWFERKDKVKSSKIKSHLKKNKSLLDVVGSPLLITVLCVLADHYIQLPDNEARLYEERLRLLTGIYDISKNITRVKTDSQTLLYFSRKIAYHLHVKNIRFDKKDKILSVLYKNYGAQYGKDRIETAFNELIDPCNILIPMTDDGMYGFGHLRYQEYLVASELLNNRGIDIRGYMGNVWWRGVLYLFSQLTDSLEFILAEMLARHIDFESYETMMSMIMARPESERNRLINIFELNKRVKNYHK